MADKITAIKHWKEFVAKDTEGTTHKLWAFEDGVQMLAMIEDLTKERDVLLALIKRMRAQWIHSVHIDDCLRAIGEMD